MGLVQAFREEGQCINPWKWERVQGSNSKSQGREGRKRGEWRGLVLFWEYFNVRTKGIRQRRIRGKDKSIVMNDLRVIFHSQSKKESWGVWCRLSHNSIFRIFLLLIEIAGE